MQYRWIVSEVGSQTKLDACLLSFTHLHIESALEQEAHAPQAFVLGGGTEGAADVLAPLLHVENGLMEVNNLRYFVWEAACSEVSTHNFLQTPCANIMV